MTSPRWVLAVLVATVWAPPVLAQSTADHNKAVVRHVFERVWNDAHFDSLSVVWAPDATFHFRGRVSPIGPEGVETTVGSWRSAFPDFRFVVEDLLAEDDRVAARLTFTGTHSATFSGIAATGRQVSATQMMFFRLEDGIIVEAWEDYDAYGLRQQLSGN